MKKIILLSIFSFFAVFLQNSLLSEVELSDTQRQLLQSLPPDQQRGVMSKMIQADALNQDLERTFEEIDTITERPERKQLNEEELKEYQEKSKSWVYGYEIFKTSPTTFAPATDIPVSGSYILGPGDEVKVQIYGNKNIELSAFVSRNGDITIPELGPVSLVGLTLEKATDLIQKKVTSETIGTDVYVSLGKLRTISVHVLGEAYQPGSFKISSLSSLSNFLFVSGGVNEKGSVRNIQVKRKGKTITTFDLYDLLLKGDTSKDIFLEQGDTIFIPLIQRTAQVYGDFRRPHLFEIKDKDKMKDLIFYAGGMEKKVELAGKLELTRLKSNASIEVSEFSISDSKFLETKVQDGDSLTARSDSQLFKGVVELKGEFKYPGVYRIKRNEKLSSVILRAGGYTEEAYPLGAVFERESVAVQQKLSFIRSADYLEQAIADTLTTVAISSDRPLNAEAFVPLSKIITRLREIEPAGRQVIEADVLKIKSDPSLDFILQPEDSLFVPSRPNEITIVGEVLNPSSLNFRTGKQVMHYIEAAGGFKETADRKNIFVILPNGESRSYAANRFKGGSKVRTLPGTTIVVPREQQPFSWTYLAKTISPLLADTATSIATIRALLDD